MSESKKPTGAGDKPTPLTPAARRERDNGYKRNERARNADWLRAKGWQGTSESLVGAARRREIELLIVIRKGKRTLSAGAIMWCIEKCAAYIYGDEAKKEYRDIANELTALRKRIAELEAELPDEEGLENFESLCEQYPSENLIALWELVGGSVAEPTQKPATDA